MTDETRITGARGRTGAAGRALMGLVLLAALAGCSSPGVTRLQAPERLAADEPRLGYSGFAGMGGLRTP